MKPEKLQIYKRWSRALTRLTTKEQLVAEVDEVPHADSTGGAVVLDSRTSRRNLRTKKSLSRNPTGVWCSWASEAWCK